MSAFHRVEDITTMRADTFVRRARCLVAYDGAVRQEAARQRAEVVRPPGDTSQPASGAQELDEDALWAAHRSQAYARYLKPGERVREVGTAEVLGLAMQAGVS